jgi:hypothetical protein
VLCGAQAGGAVGGGEGELARGGGGDVVVEDAGVFVVEGGDGDCGGEKRRAGLVRGEWKGCGVGVKGGARTCLEVTLCGLDWAEDG